MMYRSVCMASMFLQSAPGLGDQLGAIDLGDVHTQATQVSNQQDAMDTHTDIVFPHHQLPYRMLNRGAASLHTGAQDSKCEVRTHTVGR